MPVITCEIKQYSEFYVNRLGEFKEPANTPEPKIPAPFIEERLSLNFMNEYCTPPEEEALDLQFNVHNWTNFPSASRHIESLCSYFVNRADLSIGMIVSTLKHIILQARINLESHEAKIYFFRTCLNLLREKNGEENLNTVCRQLSPLIFQYLQAEHRKLLSYERCFINYDTAIIRQITGYPFIAVWNKIPAQTVTAVCFFEEESIANSLREKLRLNGYHATVEHQLRATHQVKAHLYYVKISNINTADAQL